ncbi:MAG: hypothetical protein WAU24_14595 [Chitinophagaceae bacterium]
MKRLSMPLRISVYIFLISVFVNATVSTAHILADTDYTIANIFKTFLFTLEMSAWLFVPTSIIIFLIASFYKKFNRAGLFWLILFGGIGVTVLFYSIFREVFARYSSSPEIFAAIATFSILVSTTSQYDHFMNYLKIPEKEEMREFAG